MLKIDIHAHEYPNAFLEEYIPLMTRGQAPRLNVESNVWDVDKHLSALDEVGIDIQVMSLTLPAYLADVKACMALVQIGNDAIAENCRKFPERLKAFSALPLSSVEASILEARRAIHELGMKGVILGTNVQGMAIDGEEFHPLYEELERLKVPILIHPMDVDTPSRAHAYRLNLFLGWGTETALTVARFVLGGILDRFPNLQLILSHLGGASLFALERIGEAGKRFGRMSRPVIDYYRNMYFDTAGPVSSAAVSCAKQVFGVNRLLLGTDYPFGSDHGMDYMRRAIGAIQGAGLTDDERASVESRNALNLLHLSSDK